MASAAGPDSVPR
ncbi:unnamed protein product, partial [Rotaria sordida]